MMKSLRAALLPWLFVGLSAAEPEGVSLVAKLAAGNDSLIRAALASGTDRPGAVLNHREAATRLLVYACGLVSPASRHHREPALLAAMADVVARLAAAQHPSGLFDSGNLESPPDTAFILEALAKVQLLLRAEARAETEALRAVLLPVLRRAAAAVAAGGVHTPNHRWGVCAALALVHEIEPDPRYPARISEWLAEGIDQDADGQYSERSPAYSAKVVNPALLTLIEREGLEALASNVRRNLELTWLLTEPDGEVVTLASRRQDQRPGARVSIAEYHLPARWLARKRGDRRMAGLAAWIEREFLEVLVAGPYDPNWPLPWLLSDPDLAGPLPPAEKLPDDFAAEIPGSGLLRIRRGAVSITVSGGADRLEGVGPASGLATNPVFLTYRRGRAVVSARMTPAFFGTGFFYARGVERAGSGWILRQRVDVPYHLPLPPQRRRPDGDYALTDDGRFFSKMDFGNRPKDFRTLETEISISERGGVLEVAIAVTGHPGVAVTLELAVPAEAEVNGVVPLAELRASGRGSWLPRSGSGPRGQLDAGDAYILREGNAKVAVGTDALEVGPGSFVQPPGRMEGEEYTWIGGSLRASGKRIYLTGTTPFRHRLSFR